MNQPQIIHSDNGYQYTSKWYLMFTSALEIKISKSASGKSLESREIEFWFVLLKREYLYKVGNLNVSFIKQETNNYISWYNEDRIKKGTTDKLAWVTPNEAHAYCSR